MSGETLRLVQELTGAFGVRDHQRFGAGQQRLEMLRGPLRPGQNVTVWDGGHRRTIPGRVLQNRRRNSGSRA
ncbi:hypothetical protein GCM10017782_23740 [Deinococcus ficus]|nr:hypothetical protein GCM10017782_23740 [Deinococcus ficus]